MGYINTKGGVVIEPQFNAAEIFSAGLVAVKSGSKWGYINKKGDMEIEAQFDRADPFRAGSARV